MTATPPPPPPSPDGADFDELEELTRPDAETESSMAVTKPMTYASGLREGAKAYAEALYAALVAGALVAEDGGPIAAVTPVLAARIVQAVAARAGISLV